MKPSSKLRKLAASISRARAEIDRARAEVAVEKLIAAEIAVDRAGWAFDALAEGRWVYAYASASRREPRW